MTKAKVFIYLISALIFIWLVDRSANRNIDFNCFYNAGKVLLNSQTSKSLFFTSDVKEVCEPIKKAPENVDYDYRTGFYYLPFSALFFVPFSLFDANYAVFPFTILSILSIIYAFFLIEKYIFSLDSPKQMSLRSIWLIRLAAFTMVLNYAAQGIDYTQTTSFVFLFILLCYHFMKNKKFIWSGVFLMFATFLKIFPAFISLYILLSNPFKESLKIFSSALLVVILFMLIFMVGFSRDVFLDFQELFLAIQSKATRINTDPVNQSLLAALLRFFTHNYYGNYNMSHVTLVSLDESFIKLFYYGSALLSLVFLLYLNYKVFFVSQFKRNQIENQTYKQSKDNSLIMFSLYLLYFIIFLPVSWTHYYLMSLPAIYCFLKQVHAIFTNQNQDEQKKEKILYLILLFFLLANSFTGKDILGKELYLLAHNYSHMLFSPIILFFLLSRYLKRSLIN